METISQLQLINELDKMNKDSFQYVGVWHIRTGCRHTVERMNNYIADLEAKPVKEIKIRHPISPANKFMKNYVIIDVSPAYVNVYKYVDVKNKIKGLSKQKCIVILKE